MLSAKKILAIFVTEVVVVLTAGIVVLPYLGL
jgi:hypothetical protein